MDLILLIYNVFLLLIFILAVFFAGIFFQATRSTVYLYIGTLFLFYSLDSLMIYVTEGINWFSDFYDNMFMSAPSFKTIIYTVTLFCLLRINEELLHAKKNVIFLWILIGFVLFLMFIPMFPDGALKVWCYYTPAQIFTFSLSLFGLLTIRKNPDQYSEVIQKKYRKFLLWMLVFSILILIEDTIVIFNFDIYTNITVRIQNRSITEDLLHIYQAFLAITTFVSLLIGKLDNNNYSEPIPVLPAEPAVVSSVSEAGVTETIISPSEIPHTLPVYEDYPEGDVSRFYLFSRKYQLTTREQDILKLLLDGKNNTEISNELYISLGTAKAHVHNIFSKLDVKKRQQLLNLYHEFKEVE